MESGGEIPMESAAFRPAPSRFRPFVPRQRQGSITWFPGASCLHVCRGAHRTTKAHGHLLSHGASETRMGPASSKSHRTRDLRRQHPSSVPIASTMMSEGISLSPRLLLSPPKDGPSVRRATESVSTVEFGTRRSMLGVRILHRYHPHRRG